MHPVSCKNLIVAALALCDLILMVREDQVLSASVNIDLLSKIFLRHYRALNVPARTAVTPWRSPVWLAFLLRLPENEIKGIFLLVLAGHLKCTESGLKIVQVLMGKLAVFFKFLHTEIHGSVRCRISIALVHKGLDHADHAVDFLGCLRMCGSRLYIHASHILSCTLQCIWWKSPLRKRPPRSLS